MDEAITAISVLPFIERKHEVTVDTQLELHQYLEGLHTRRRTIT